MDEQNFSLLQQRAISVRHMDLCSAMDLVALVTKDNTVSIYRTITWERVLQKKGVAASSGVGREQAVAMMYTCVKFTPAGDFIAFGCENGNLDIVNVETQCWYHISNSENIASVAATSPTGTISSSSSSSTASVIALLWQKYEQRNLFLLPLTPTKQEQESGRSSDWLSGGVYQVERTGMVEYDDNTTSNNSAGNSSSSSSNTGGGGGGGCDGMSVASLNQLRTNSGLLLALQMDGSLRGFAVGLFPLFSISIANSLSTLGMECPLAVAGLPYLNSSDHTQTSTSLTFCSTSTTSTTSSSSTSSPMLSSSTEARASVVSVGSAGTCQLVFRPEFRSLYSLLERSAVLHLRVRDGLDGMVDLLVTCGRKWKEAVKTAGMKLSLLQSLLDGYQMDMSPVQFFFSISMCGLWHPAAQASFSQHWNDQGLARFKSSVDSASRFVMESLQLRGVPTLTNIVLACRELVALEHKQRSLEAINNDRSNSSSSSSSSKNRSSNSSSSATLLKNCLGAAELLLFKLDSANVEAKLAREGMLLYIQFVQDCVSEITLANDPAAAAAAAANADANHKHRIDPGMRSKYQKLFDPRVLRAPYEKKGPASHLQGEYVTGTHLYAHLTHNSNSNNSNSNNSNSNNSNSKLAAPSSSNDRSAGTAAAFPLGALPPGLEVSRRQMEGGFSIPIADRKRDSADITQLSELGALMRKISEEVNGYVLCADGEGDVDRRKEGEEPRVPDCVLDSQSLLDQVHIAKECFKKCFDHIHSDMSSRLQSEIVCAINPSSLPFSSSHHVGPAIPAAPVAAATADQRYVTGFITQLLGPQLSSAVVAQDHVTMRRVSIQCSDVVVTLEHCLVSAFIFKMQHTDSSYSSNSSRTYSSSSNSNSNGSNAFEALIVCTPSRGGDGNDSSGVQRESEISGMYCSRVSLANVPKGYVLDTVAQTLLYCRRRSPAAATGNVGELVGVTVGGGGEDGDDEQEEDEEEEAEEENPFPVDLLLLCSAIASTSGTTTTTTARDTFLLRLGVKDIGYTSFASRSAAVKVAFTKSDLLTLPLYSVSDDDSRDNNNINCRSRRLLVGEEPSSSSSSAASFGSFSSALSTLSLYASVERGVVACVFRSREAGGGGNNKLILVDVEADEEEEEEEEEDDKDDDSGEMDADGDTD